MRNKFGNAQSYYNFLADIFFSFSEINLPPAGTCDDLKVATGVS